MSYFSLPRIALTPGEPAGIGPDLVIQIAQQALPAELVVIADQNLLQERAQQLQLPLQINDYDPDKLPRNKKHCQLTVWHTPLNTPCHPGKLDIKNVHYVLTTLTRATEGCLKKEFAALVTGPVHKGIINAAGIKFSGHTEFFAEFTGASHVVMLLMTQKLRVALTTTHIPLRDVADFITASQLTETLCILQQGLQHYFGLAKPRILVCGLNPHAGEDGYIGREEIDVIIPVLDSLRKIGMHLIGPVPADTAFTPKNLEQADAVLTMYHDQGLPVLKYSDFENAINVTLGLPFLRTSVDHGTALDLAGTGHIQKRSLLAAIQTAIEFSLSSQH